MFRLRWITLASALALGEAGCGAESTSEQPNQMVHDAAMAGAGTGGRSRPAGVVGVLGRGTSGSASQPLATSGAGGAGGAGGRAQAGGPAAAGHAGTGGRRAGGAAGAAGNAAAGDSDGDGHTDAGDNCPGTPNPNQSDLDGDLDGDACDVDRDGDGVANAMDTCPDFDDPNQSDTDDDGTGDACDDDRDGDMIGNAIDNCPGVENASQYDLDADGAGTACDDDDEVVRRGTLTDWSEQEKRHFDTLAGANGSGLPLWWTVSSLTLVWIYGREPGLEVAAPGLTSFAAVTDADAFTYSDDVVRIEAGQIALLRNTQTGTYGALRLESVRRDGEIYRANMSWLFAGHSKNFATLP